MSRPYEVAVILSEKQVRATDFGPGKERRGIRMPEKEIYSVDESTPENTPNSTDESKPKGKRISLPRWLKPALKFGAFLFFLEVVEELVGAFTGWFLWDALPKVVTAVIGIAATLCSGLLSVYLDKNRGDLFHHSDNMSCWEHAPVLMKRVYNRYIRYNTLLFMIICLVIAVCLPAYCAKIGVTRHMCNLSSQGLKIAAEILTPNHSEPEETGDDSTPSPETTAPPSSSHPIDEGLAASSAAADIPSEEPDSPLVPLSRRLRLLPGMDYQVSDEERSEILFQTGDYAIAAEDWGNDNLILSKVRSFAEDQRKLRRKVSYAQSELPRSDSANISSASVEEAEMLEAEDPTSNDLRSVIDKREVSYQSSPFYSLSTLIRENFCMYGDAIHLQGGERADAATLFMKSILYGFEALQFDVSAAAFAGNLEILSERFLKLSNVLTPNSDEARYASHLAGVFQILSQEFS